MSARVRLAGSGREFSVEGSESLLEAALRAGLAMPYGCSSGNCGECKARILQGRAGPLRHHDYRLTEDEKREGVVLMCCSSALNDLEIETRVAHAAAEIPEQRIAVQVRKLEPIAGEILLLELLMPRSSRLRYLAGQSATLEVGAASATLPIASCPCEERRLQFHLLRGANGPPDEAPLATLRPGASVTVRGPVGEFVLREEGARPLAFVAWGWRAFAPVKSLIEHALALEAAASIALCWIAGDASEHYLENLCRSWAQAMDNFRYSLPVGDAGALAGLEAPADADWYVAGAERDVAATRAFLAAAGLAADRIRTWSPP